jgi:hypothetical protein
MPTYAFEEVIIKTCKIQNIFIRYPKNIYFNELESSKMGRRLRIFFVILTIVYNVNS